MFDAIKEILTSEKKLTETNNEKLKKALHKKQLDRF